MSNGLPGTIVQSWQSSVIPWVDMPQSYTPTKFPSAWSGTSTSRWVFMQSTLQKIKRISSPPVFARGRGGNLIRGIRRAKYSPGPPVLAAGFGGYTLNQIAVIGVLKHG